MTTTTKEAETSPISRKIYERLDLWAPLADETGGTDHFDFDDRKDIGLGNVLRPRRGRVIVLELIFYKHVILPGSKAMTAILLEPIDLEQNRL